MRLKRAGLVFVLLGVAASVRPTAPFGSDAERRASKWSVMTTALAQDDLIGALSDEYAKLESEGLKENYIRLLSYTMLQEYLPPGTRFTSGYRSPQKQLDLILRMARAKGIPTPSTASIEDENSWRGALMGLRSQGIIIAAPTTTPHATDEAVFDLSGADLNSIQAGLRQAEKAGMVKFRRIIFEARNNAIHVEVESLSPKALNALGRRRGSSQGSGSSSSSSTQTGTGTGTTQPPASESDQRQSMLQQLQNLHDSEPDPTKKIDYDRSKKNLLDPLADAERIRALDAEIAAHMKESELLGSQGEKRAAIESVSAALREERYEDAELEAERLVEEYPELQEAQRMLAQIKTRRLVNEAMDALYASDEPACGDCQLADELINEALELSPNHEGAQVIREDVNACLERCKSRPLLAVALIAMLFVVAGGGVGLFFLLRSGKASSLVPQAGAAGGLFAGSAKRSHRWVLEGVEGACRGQVFPLEKPEITIGSKGPPEGVADIVVLDANRKISRRHCVIMQNGKQFYLIDESTNGTKLNGRELARGVTAEFRSGDRISLADEAVLMLRPG